MRKLFSLPHQILLSSFWYLNLRRQNVNLKFLLPWFHPIHDKPGEHFWQKIGGLLGHMLPAIRDHF